ARANLKQIATAAQSAADEIDPLAATKNPRLAHAKVRNLETARKATTKLIPPRPQRAATVRERSSSCSSPVPTGEVSRPVGAEGVSSFSPPPPHLRGRCPDKVGTEGVPSSSSLSSPSPSSGTGFQPVTPPLHSQTPSIPTDP